MHVKTPNPPRHVTAVDVGYYFFLRDQAVITTGSCSSFKIPKFSIISRGVEVAYSEITPVKKSDLAIGGYSECSEEDATHWYIGIGFGGNDGFLILPSRDSAVACMDSFVSPYEMGVISPPPPPPPSRK